MYKTDHALISRIYSGIDSKFPFSGSLDLFAGRYGARGSTLMINDHAEPLVSQLYLSLPDLTPLIAEFMDRFGQDEQVTIQALGARKQRFEFLSEEEGYGMPASQIPANLWQKEHLGLNRRYAARLSITPIWFDVITINFPNGHSGLTKTAARDAADYMLHFSTALEMLRPFRLLQARFNAVASVLDRLKIGIGLLTKKGELVLQNNRLDTILQQGDGLSLSGSKKLMTPSILTEDQARYSAGLQAITSGDLTDGGEFRFSIARPSGKTAYVASLCALAPMVAGDPKASELAALIIKDPESTDRVSVQVLRQLCGLTQSEAEVCEMVVNGTTVREVAHLRDVSEGSTRNQLASVMQKTGTSSQSQLVRFALSADLPVEDAKPRSAE